MEAAILGAIEYRSAYKFSVYVCGGSPATLNQGHGKTIMTVGLVQATTASMVRADCATRMACKLFLQQRMRGSQQMVKDLLIIDFGVPLELKGDFKSFCKQG